MPIFLILLIIVLTGIFLIFAQKIIMPQIVIKYKSPKTLKALKGLAKYFDFVILSSKQEKDKEKAMHGVTIIPGDSTLDTSDLTKIFTGKGLNAKELRAKAWQRGR